MADPELQNIHDEELREIASAKRDDSDSGLDNTSDSGQSEEDIKDSFTSDSDESDIAPVAPKRRSKTSLDESCHIIVDETSKCPFRLGVPDKHSKVLCQLISPEVKIDIPRHTDDIAVLEIDEPVIANQVLFDKHLNNNNIGEIPEDVKKAYLEKFEGIEYFHLLSVKGQLESVDFGVSLDDRPKWLDVEKYKRGQQFAQKYIFCLNFAEMVSLLMLFALKAALQPLIFTGRSHTPFKAFQRYLSTFLRLKSWYEGDIWNDKNDLARKNMSVVKAMHLSVAKKLTESTDEEIELKGTLGDEKETALWCPLRESLKEDFQGSCPVALPGTNPYDYGRNVWVNQLDMAITQFGFVGLAVTYPEEFGIHGASEEDLDAFLHMWRGLGFLLGIKDDYNFCNAELDVVRKRTKAFINIGVKPAFRDISSDWEHMSRCVIQGIGFYIPGVTFEVSLQYLMDVLNIHTPRLKKSFSFFHKFMYAASKFVFRYMFRVPAILRWNTTNLLKAVKRAQDASPEKLAEWEQRKFSYMKQEKTQLL